jgi:hypothetical protein
MAVQLDAEAGPVAELDPPSLRDGLADEERAEHRHELGAAVRLDSTSVQTRGLLGYAYAKSGDTKRAGDIAKGLEAGIGRTSGAAAAAARVYLGLGDPSRLALLEARGRGPRSLLLTNRRRILRPDSEQSALR